MPGYLFSKTEFHSKFMKQIMACRNPKATEQQTTVIDFKLAIFLPLEIFCHK